MEQGHKRMIKCYGGPFHGQIIPWDGNFHPIRVLEYQSQFKASFHDGPLCTYNNYATYHIEVYQEYCGQGFRETQVAVIEGCKLSLHDEYDLVHNATPWRPIQPPKPQSLQTTRGHPDALSKLLSFLSEHVSRASDSRSPATC